MTVVAPATEFVPVPNNGRVFGASGRVRLGDVDDRARLRLDALSRYLQDVATDDTADTTLDDGFNWVVRRTMVEVRQTARLDEDLELRTFCSGTGRSWAERRTSITGSRGGSIETVSLWIRIDPTSGRPTALGEEFLSVYGESAAGRRVSSRLRLPPPPEDVEQRSWPIRRVDIDPLRHVNNAVHWAIVEETLPAGPRRGCAEIEYLAPIDPETDLQLASSAGEDGERSSWLLAGGTVLTAARWMPAP